MPNKGTKNSSSDDRRTMGERIKQLRTNKLAIDQSKLASLVGVTAMAVSKWERDQNAIDMEHLKRLAEETGVGPDWLLNGESPPERFVKLWELLSIVDEQDREWLFEQFEFVVMGHLREARQRKKAEK